MLTVAISCVDDYVSNCLHKSEVVHEMGKRNQTQMVCYICYSEGHVSPVSLCLLSRICVSRHVFVTPVTIENTNMQHQSHKCVSGCISVSAVTNVRSWSHVDPLCLRLHLEHHLQCHSMPIFNNAQGAISSTKGKQSQHVTRITFVTGVTLEQPESHLCNQRQIYATGVTY